MAGRIRTIKPELLEDERTAGLSDRSWRLFVSMLLLADDYGNLRGSATYLGGAVFWARELPIGRVAESMQELLAAGLITSYTVHEQHYLAIKGWSKHQRVDRPSPARIPGPQAEIREITLASDSRVIRERLATDQDQDQDQDPDRDREGASAPVALAAAERQPLLLAAPKCATPDPREEICARLWAAQDQLRREVNQRARPLRLTDAARASVLAVLSEHSEEDCDHVLRVYAAEARRARTEGKSDWFDGVSNWRPENFRRALGRDHEPAPQQEWRFRG